MNSFITKPKPKQDGTFWSCKKCNKTPIVGQDIYMENLGTKESPTWIACLDLECFIAQGGHKPDPNSKPFKAKTPKELFEYRKELSNFAFDYAKEKCQHVVGNLSTDEKFKLFYEGIIHT
jgi:hypothetical protein